MFENGLPWYVPTAGECEAAGAGVIHSFTKLKILRWEDVPKEGLSPQWTASIQDEYHYYSAGFYVPRIILLAIVLVRAAVFTDIFNSKEAVSGLFNLLFGVTI